MNKNQGVADHLPQPSTNRLDPLASQKKVEAHAHLGAASSLPFERRSLDENQMFKDDQKVDQEKNQKRGTSFNGHISNQFNKEGKRIEDEESHGTAGESRRSTRRANQDNLHQFEDGKKNGFTQKDLTTAKILDKSNISSLDTVADSNEFVRDQSLEHSGQSSTFTDRNLHATLNHRSKDATEKGPLFKCLDQSAEVIQERNDSQGDFPSSERGSISQMHQQVSASPNTSAYSLIRDRERRSCRDKTTKYSLTHKGVYSSMNDGDDLTLSHRKSGHGDHEQLNALAVNETTQEHGHSREQRQDGKPSKKSAPRTTEQCLQIIKNMFAFDWSLKDIINLRHSPQQEFTASIFWFYVNTQYFPFEALELSEKPLEDLVAPVLLNLQVPSNDLSREASNNLNVNRHISYNENSVLDSQNLLRSNRESLSPSRSHVMADSQSHTEDSQNGLLTIQQARESISSQQSSLNELLSPLFRDKIFKRFKSVFRESLERMKPEVNRQVSQLHQQMMRDLEIKIQEGVKKLSYEDVSEQDEQLKCEENIEEAKIRKQEFKIEEKVQNGGEGTAIVIQNDEAINHQEDLAQRRKELEDSLRAQTQTEFYKRKASIEMEMTIKFIQDEINNHCEQNQDEVRQVAQKFKHQFGEALELASLDEVIKDPFVYQQEQISKYGQAFIEKIDPMLIQEFLENKEWFKENFNEILMNVGHPSKLEKDFLKHIEQVQQRKSDFLYKKILKHLEQGKRGDQLSAAELEQFQTLNSATRNQAAQDDAQCVICNNGDYEEEDMIVFCGNCNVPVHQSCYGIEQLPEGDWVCYNCDLYGMKRGLLVKCLFCPKRGGAMKPTNIFSSGENFRRFNPSSNSHNAKKSTKKQGQLVQALNERISFRDESLGVFEDNFYELEKIHLGENEDKNLSLNVIINREYDYQSDLRQLAEKENRQLEHLELQFDANEKVNQTPEDYQFFLHKNTNVLESHPSAESLYQWVHLSCASWIPGPIVTPKTPVRLNKFDEKRFQLQCIICLRRDGACMQCQAPRCQIAFHVECARRNNYCMEIERKEREKSYRMFCEKHRPLKIVKELEERDRQTIDEIQRFCKIIDKCVDIDYKHQLKPSKQREREKELQRLQQQKLYEQERLKLERQKRMELKMMSSAERRKHRDAERMGRKDRPPKAEKPPKIKKEKPPKIKKIKEIVKKWREKDKKMLFERIKERYLMFRKMRVNIMRVDPMRKLRGKGGRQAANRKRSKKRLTKKQQQQQQLQQAQAQSQVHLGGLRPGLRSTNAPQTEQDDKHQDILQLQSQLLQHEQSQRLLEEEKLQDRLLLSNSVSEQLLQQQDSMFELTQTHPGEQTENFQNEEEDKEEEDEESQEVYYKLTIPVNPPEVDWTITLSRNDFPWFEIKFSYFTAKDCYEKYTSIVKDPQTFLKKVLGNKEKYKKMMQSQIAMASSYNYSAVGQLPQGVVLTKEQDFALYCVCKGAIQSDFYLGCDGDQECPLNGWVHPQCIAELKDKSKEEIDEIEQWYCEFCRARIKKEEDDEARGIDPNAQEEEEDIDIENGEEEEDDNDEEEKSDEDSYSVEDREMEEDEDFELNSSNIDQGVANEGMILEQIDAEKDMFRRERSNSNSSNSSSSSESQSHFHFQNDQERHLELDGDYEDVEKVSSKNQIPQIALERKEHIDRQESDGDQEEEMELGQEDEQDIQDALMREYNLNIINQASQQNYSSIAAKNLYHSSLVQQDCNHDIAYPKENNLRNGQAADTEMKIDSNMQD